MLMSFYRTITAMSGFWIKRYLNHRLKAGKEHPHRLAERFGVAGMPRPLGDLVWCHGASVGESVSLLPLVQELHRQGVCVLVTTGTVTSAAVMENKLPAEILHQFIPADVPQWVERFLDHWQPTVGLFVESELWPNMLMGCKRRKIPLILANAHLSQKSFRRWQLVRRWAQSILASFSVCLAQSKEVADRLRALGAVDVRVASNLKFSVPPLTVDGEALSALQKIIGDRPIWAAVSTHPGEEAEIMKAHRLIQEKIPDILTVLIPRHPRRAEEIQQLLQNDQMHVARRSLHEDPTPDCDIYLADTIGEMGLFYRLCPISFIGGTFANIGGHNPIEPIKLSSCVLWGPVHHNFAEIATLFGDTISLVDDASALANAVIHLIQNPEKREKQVEEALKCIAAQQHGLMDVMDVVSFYMKNKQPVL